MSLWIIFLTGLTTGGLSCLAVQGGLLASVITNQKEEEFEKDGKNTKFSSFDVLDWQPALTFLFSKLVSHSVLGFFLGMLGSAFSISLGIRLTFQAFTAFFMFATAMNLLDVHPVFRYVSFQPPRFVQRFVYNRTKSKAFFAPAVLGALTIFIPCGVTQAMEVLAISSGSPIQGALIMFVFVLGTSPLFAGLGITTAKLSEGWREKFLKFAAVVLVFMSLYSINGILTVLDSPFSFQKLANAAISSFDKKFSESEVVEVVDGVQKVTIEIFPNGYSPKYFKVKQNTLVEMTVENRATYTCAADFTFREFGIREFIGVSDAKIFTFTPTQKGKFTFSCSMGMYSGVMEVI